MIFDSHVVPHVMAPVHDDTASDGAEQPPNRFGRRGFLGTAAGAAALGILGAGSASAHDGDHGPNPEFERGSMDLKAILDLAWDANTYELILYEKGLDAFSEGEFEWAYRDYFGNAYRQYSTYQAVEWLYDRERLQISRLEAAYDDLGIEKPTETRFDLYDGRVEWIFESVENFVAHANDWEWTVARIQASLVDELLLHEHERDTEYATTARALKALLNGLTMDKYEEGVLRMLDMRTDTWNFGSFELDAERNQYYGTAFIPSRRSFSDMLIEGVSGEHIIDDTARY